MVVALVTALGLVSPVALTAHADESVSPAAKAAADWLYAEANEDGSYSGWGGEVHAGATADAVLALAFVDGSSERLTKVAKAFAANAKSWVMPEDGAISNGAAGKALMTADIAGLDWTNVDGLNLRDVALRTLDERGKSVAVGLGNDYNGTFNQALVMIGLARTGSIPAKAVDFLVTQQCSDGSFAVANIEHQSCDQAGDEANDPDVAALGLTALRAAKAQGYDVDDEITKAVGWFQSHVGDEGGYAAFGTENANSTGMAAQALVGLSDVSGLTAFVETLQVPAGAEGKLAGEDGAIAWSKLDLSNASEDGIGTRSSWVLATAQGIFALAPQNLYSYQLNAPESSLDPKIEISTVADSDDVVVAGSGFAPGSEVVITLAGPGDEVQELGKATAGADGTFSTEVKLPENLAGGNYILSATSGDYAFASSSMGFTISGEEPGEEPGDTKPDETKPDQTKPDQTKPDQTKPDQTKPDQKKSKKQQPVKPALPNTGVNDGSDLGLVALGLAVVLSAAAARIKR